MKYVVTLISLIILCYGIVPAQEQLSVQQAIDFALNNNYSIRITKEKSHQAQLANTYSMTGALPQVNVSGTIVPIDLDDGVSVSPQSNHTVYASMPLFNGQKVVATKQQLEALQTQGQLALTLSIQNTMALVMQQYFELVRQQQYISILQTSLDVARERLLIVKTRESVGLANNADVLQASIDVSAIEQSISQQYTTIAQSKSELLFTIGRKESVDISLTDSITTTIVPAYEVFIQKLEQNPQLMYAQLSSTIAQTAIKQIRAQRYPSVKMFSSYSFEIPDGISANTMPMVGLSYAIPIYSGGMYKTQQAIAQSKLAVSQIEQEQLRHQLITHLFQTYTAYEQTMQQLQKQIDTYEYSQQLLHVVMKRFESNMATMLEVKAAQLSFEQAGYILANQRFAAKMAEIELLRLVCELK